MKMKKAKEMSTALEKEININRQAESHVVYIHAFQQLTNVGDITWITQFPSTDYLIIFSDIERKDQGSWRRTKFIVQAPDSTIKLRPCYSVQSG